MTTPIIKIRDLTYRYGDFTAVKDVTFDVFQGEIFGFLGPNGAGKTTTIRMLLDFIRPAEGDVRVFGLDAREQSQAIRKRLGYLPSELTLWENMTGTQYIRWLSQVHAADLLPHARTLAERLDFDLTRSLKGMSTGMKRKIGLIATLAHQPELLILDEPTIGLDPLMQEEFHQIMTEIRAEGRTVFMSSHSLPEVEEICDRVAIIRQGEIQAVETIKNLTQVTFRWLTLTFDQPVASSAFEHLDGLSHFEQEDTTLKMRLSGDADLNAVIQCIAQHTIVDMNLSNPSLEEIFLSYYGKVEAV